MTMNPMLLEELLFDLAITQDLVGPDVRGRLRTMSKEIPELSKIKPQEVEARVNNMRAVWAAARPVERSAIRLAALESGLRGRLQEAILNLELKHPGDIRDACKAAQALQANPRPEELEEALGYLAEAGVNIDALRKECYALYPEDCDDEVEPVPAVIAEPDNSRLDGSPNTSGVLL